jgi:hypothetical protein
MASFILIIGQGGCGDSGISVATHHERWALVPTHEDQGTDTHRPGTLRHHMHYNAYGDFTVYSVVCVCVGVPEDLLTRRFEVA